MRTAVEGTVDLSVGLAFLFEDFLQEHQRGLQAVHVTLTLPSETSILQEPRVVTSQKPALSIVSAVKTLYITCYCVANMSVQYCAYYRLG
jgi:hypothetical protein